MLFLKYAANSLKKATYYTLCIAAAQKLNGTLYTADQKLAKNSKHNKQPQNF